MNCPEYKDKIPLYALGELPADERDKIEIHLQVCAACRAECESLLAVVGMYEENVDALTPIDKLKLENNILRRMIKTRNKAGNSFRLFGPWSTPARMVAAVLIFFAGFTAQFFMGQFSGPQQAAISKTSRTVAVAPINKALVSSMRFSSQGLKVIAHGKDVFKVAP